MAETVEILNAKVVVDASSVTQAKSQFNAAIDEMTAKTKQAGAATTEMGNQTKQAANQIGISMAAAAGAVSLFVAAIYMASKVIKELEVAAKFRAMAQASRNMADSFGVDSARISQALDQVSNRTLSAEAKFRMMNEAMLAGGADVADKLPQLYEIANAIAIARNESTEASFERLFTGIERGSSKMINAILPNALKVNDVVAQYAAQHGIAANAVDDHTAMLLMMNEALIKGLPLVDAIGKTTGNEVDAFTRLNIATDQFGKTLMQIPLITGPVIETLGTAVTAASQLVAILASAVAGGWALVISAMQIGTTISAFGINVRVGGAKDFSDIAKDANKAFEDSFKRMSQAQGVVYGTATDPRERARQRILAQSQAFADQEAAAEVARLAKEKTTRDKMNEIIISSGDKARNSEQGWMQDVVDLNIEHQQKLVEIALDGARERQDIELNFARQIENADLEFQQTVEDAQAQSANRRAEIEQRYQDKLYQIQRRFQDSYWNAVKNRDAVALVEAVRDRNRGIEDAGRQRDQDIGNEDAQEQQRIRNAAIAHQRKLEDAQRYYERAMQDQRIAQQRAIEDENLQRQYREIELGRHFDWRLQEIDRAMNQELATAQAKYSQAEADYSTHLANMAAIAAAYMGSLGIGGASGGGGYTNPRTRKRQSGGVDLVTSPTPFLMGEGNSPELVITIPMGGSQQMLPAPMSHTVSGDVRHQVDMIAANGMRGMEARIIAATMQALREVYRR